MKGTLTLRKPVEQPKPAVRAFTDGCAGKSVEQCRAPRDRLSDCFRSRKYDVVLTDVRGRKIICRKSQIVRCHKRGEEE